MKTIYHAADSRGYADHGWLKSNHTFSFANYHDPNRMNFGALRVINDDYIEGGKGFGVHPHRDMEIISIPLSGKLSHGDSIGNEGVITAGEIQVMSAGTGIQHSEMNGDKVDPVTLLQIWVIPNQMNVKPRYQQLQLANLMKPNQFNQVLSPNSEDEGVWIHQDAWFSLGDFDQGINQSYQFKKENNGVYAFVIEGKVKIGEQTLNARDGLGIWDTSSLNMEVLEQAKVLLMEVPIKS